MIPREGHYYFVHHQPRQAVVVDCHNRATAGNSLQLESLACDIRPSTLFRSETARGRHSASPSIQSISANNSYSHCELMCEAVASSQRVHAGALMPARTIIKNSTIATRISRTRVISNSSFSVLRRVGVCSCVLYRGSSARKPSKANDHLASAPNNRSVKTQRSFLQSPECFGPTRQRLILRLRSIVRCAPRSFGSPANANGPAMRSLQSSKKFSIGTACAMCA